MTKIAIISQAEQGVVIDISGCSSLSEAKQYLTSTLQVSSQFWDGLIVDLNLGPLVLTLDQVNEIQAIVSEVGVRPRQIFTSSPITHSALLQSRMPIAPTEAGAASVTSPAPDDSVEVEQEISSVAIAGSSDFVPGEITVLQREQQAPVFLSMSTPEYKIADKQAPQGASSLPDLFLQARSAALAADSLPETASVAVPDFTSAPETKQVQRTAAAGASMAAPSANKAQKPQSQAVLMMKQTLRSGQRISHKGHLVIIGDVNPGAEIVADGDITVWGALRGMAHAGASGNSNAEIRALKFEPIQLRIAQAIARSPDRSKPAANMPAGPETARVVEGKIRIAGSEPE